MKITISVETGTYAGTLSEFEVSRKISGLALNTEYDRHQKRLLKEINEVTEELWKLIEKGNEND